MLNFKIEILELHAYSAYIINIWFDVFWHLNSDDYYLENDDKSLKFEFVEMLTILFLQLGISHGWFGCGLLHDQSNQSKTYHMWHNIQSI